MYRRKVLKYICLALVVLFSGLGLSALIAEPVKNVEDKVCVYMNNEKTKCMQWRTIKRGEKHESIANFYFNR